VFGDNGFLQCSDKDRKKDIHTIDNDLFKKIKNLDSKINFSCLKKYVMGGKCSFIIFQGISLIKN
jgi:hypothetical protein